MIDIYLDVRENVAEDLRRTFGASSRANQNLGAKSTIVVGAYGTVNA